MSNSLMNETRDTRDTLPHYSNIGQSFGGNSQNDYMDSSESKILASGVFQGINTDSTTENQNVGTASNPTISRSPDASSK